MAAPYCSSVSTAIPSTANIVVTCQASGAQNGQAARGRRDLPGRLIAVWGADPIPNTLGKIPLAALRRPVLGRAWELPATPARGALKRREYRAFPYLRTQACSSLCFHEIPQVRVRFLPGSRGRLGEYTPAMRSASPMASGISSSPRKQTDVPTHRPREPDLAVSARNRASSQRDRRRSVRNRQETTRFAHGNSMAQAARSPASRGIFDVGKTLISERCSLSGPGNRASRSWIDSWCRRASCAAIMYAELGFQRSHFQPLVEFVFPAAHKGWPWATRPVPGTL